jgi:hypothetical protein
MTWQGEGVRTNLRQSWLIPATLALVVVSAFVAPVVLANAGRSIVGAGSDPAPVTARDARIVVDELVSLATARTTASMHKLCDLSRIGCAGMSGGLEHDPLAHLSAPHPTDPVRTRCERTVGDGSWMVVLEGVDGHGRSYVSQLVFERDRGGRVLLTHEPAYWLGIGYGGPKVTGSTSLSMAHHTRVGGVDPAMSERVLNRARASCAPPSEGGAV